VRGVTCPTGVSRRPTRPCLLSFCCAMPPFVAGATY
jgi:hypothetical protein